MIPLHQVEGTLPTNSSTTKTYSFGFTATSGSLLIAIVNAGATATTPTGWTMHKQYAQSHAAYVFSKTSNGTESSVTWTQNGDRAAAVALWEYPVGAQISSVTDFYSRPANTTPGTIDVSGDGSWLVAIVGANSGTTTGPTATWTGSVTEVVEIASANVTDNAAEYILAAEVDFTAPATISATCTAGGYGVNILIGTAAVGGASTLLAQYNALAVTTHNIAFSTPSAVGSDVILFASSSAVMTKPSGWVEDNAYQGSDHSVVWRLPGAANTTGISSVTITLSAASDLAAVVIQDYVSVVGYSRFDTSTGAIAGAGDLVGTGLHTFAVQDVAFAVFRMAKASWSWGSTVISSTDQGYTVIGQAKTDSAGAGTNGHLMGVAAASSAAMANNGVTATLSPALTTGNASTNTAFPGMIAYSRRSPGADVTPPSITARTPAPNATGVALSAGVSLTFSEAVTGVAVSLTRPGPVTVAGNLTGSGVSWGFQPTANMLSNTVHTVNVTGAKDSANNTMTPASWTFTTVAVDTTPPTVTSRTPAAGATNVAIGTVVNVGFSEAVNTVTITMNRSGTNVPGTVSGSGISRVFTPSASLTASTVYTVVVSSAVDTSGNTQVGTDTWTFTTAAADTTAPTVTSRTPAPNATDISVGTTVTVGFSETVTSATITMTRAGNSVPGSVGGTGTSRTFTPSSALLVSSVYTVNVSGATDASGNVQSGTDTWTFTTAASGGVSWGATIQQEVAQAGTPATQWSVGGAGDATNQGFAKQFSVSAGGVVNFAVDGDCTLIDIYRVGGYDTGWRLVGTISNTPTVQPLSTTVASSNGTTTCAAWTTTASWTVPAQAWSGLFVALVRNAALNNGSWVPFVVRNDARTADIVVKTSETTWGMAYNSYGVRGNIIGGACVYGIGGLGTIEQRSFVGTLDKPIVTRQGIEQTYWTNAEQPFWAWLDKQGYNWKMVSSADIDAGLTTVGNAKVLCSVGHDEYWSDGMRNNFEAFRDNGGNLMFLSGNEVFWRIRYSDATRRTFWCYKDTMNGPAPHVPGTALDPVTWTGTWKDTRWVARKPENTITGTDFRMNGVRDETATINAATYGISPFWRNTTVATGSTLTLPRVIGMEGDAILPTQAGAVVVAQTTINVSGSYADNNGENYSGTGNLNWGIVLQRYLPSGSVVAGFGTCQWQWALDGLHARTNTTPSLAAQQATVNLLLDMGVSPATPGAGIVMSTAVPWTSYGLPAPPSATEGNTLKVSDGTVWYEIVAEAGPHNHDGTYWKVWTGTQTAYNAISTKDSTTLYVITG